jgi:hypothetical protein
MRSVRARLVFDGAHYTDLVTRLRRATISVLDRHREPQGPAGGGPVGTRARAAGRYVSLIGELVELARRGVEVRVLARRAPLPRLPAGLRCGGARGGRASPVPPRAPKLVCVDGAELYLGSANFTGAGLGAKAEGRRNFELGVVTDDDVFLDQVQARFAAIWGGGECGLASCAASVQRRSTDEGGPPAVARRVIRVAAAWLGRRRAAVRSPRPAPPS